MTAVRGRGGQLDQSLLPTAYDTLVELLGRLIVDALIFWVTDDLGRIPTERSRFFIYCRFYKKYWKALKTTNGVERVNKELKRRTKSMEAIGKQSLQAVVALTALRLEMGWQLNQVDSKAFDSLMVGSVKQNGIKRLLKK